MQDCFSLFSFTRQLSEMFFFFCARFPVLQRLVIRLGVWFDVVEHPLLLMMKLPVSVPAVCHRWLMHCAHPHLRSPPFAAVYASETTRPPPISRSINLPLRHMIGLKSHRPVVASHLARRKPSPRDSFIPPFMFSQRLIIPIKTDFL